MVILAFYGIHRYQLVWLYYRNKRNEAKSHRAARALHRRRASLRHHPAPHLQRAVRHRPPHRRLLPHSTIPATASRSSCSTTPPTRPSTSPAPWSRAIAAGTQGLHPQPVYYLHRTNRYGYKAGALEEGLKIAKGELIAIFDADFVPPPQWLSQVVHHFAEPGVGMVQTRWTHLNRNYSFLTQVEAILLDGHFVLEHGGRSRAGVFFNFNGTAGMWRRAGHRRGRRLAARHPHRRHRPQLPRPAQRLEVQVPAGRRVPRRAAHRDDRLQDPAGTLGQGPHPDRQKDPAQRPHAPTHPSTPSSKPGTTSPPTSATRS